jgi:hypothetical protein
MTNPFVAAIGASLGSVVIMGGATIAVASVSLAVVQTIATQHKVRIVFSNRYASITK